MTMRKTTSKSIRFITLVALGILAAGNACMAQATATSAQINAADLDKEIKQFLAREVSAHVADIKTLDPPPDRVVGALTTGEFSWGTFMHTLGAYSAFAGTRPLRAAM